MTIRFERKVLQTMDELIWVLIPHISNRVITQTVKKKQEPLTNNFMTTQFKREELIVEKR